MDMVPLADARNRLSAVIEEVASTHEVVTITRNGVPAAVILAADDYESLIETLALAADPDAQRRLAAAEAEYARGDYVTGEEMGRLMEERRRREARTA